MWSPYVLLFLLFIQKITDFVIVGLSENFHQNNFFRTIKVFLLFILPYKLFIFLILIFYFNFDANKNIFKFVWLDVWYFSPINFSYKTNTSSYVAWNEETRLTAPKTNLSFSMILRDRSMLYRMGLCTKLCDQKWPSSEEKVYTCLNYSNGPVSEKRDLL